MKWKVKLVVGLTLFISFISLLTFVALFVADEPQNESSYEFENGLLSVSADVLKHKPLVEKYAKLEGIEEYIQLILAIIQVESGGKGNDVMQSSESIGLPPNSFTNPEDSIKQGVHYIAELVRSAKSLGVDQPSVIQSYNYGGGFLNYVASNGKKYSFELAQAFSKEKANGQKVTYTNPIAIPINGGWRYTYGNMFYNTIVSQYLQTNTTKFDNKTVQLIMDEALKYQGYPYVFGGSNPSTSFDCSGITQWCFQKGGITLPRTAQAQYDAMAHLPLSQAEPGDLIFFHSTYSTADYVTHVGIYVGNNRMYHAGAPIGYADLNNSYWQQHLIGAGRIKK
ncbi:TPA: bifunctional lysozyme/C40 family peptidase [Listeria monocytogenes]|nr:peptidase P60 [Listeria monocytogenes]HAA9071016.1 peptidase P60 [Listeria monocytogenes]HDI4828569.1 bifunctional lysozyme/C40 family peptidase [Listeria monocytogenes]HDM9928150.1 bifunctional lysozyme/C40 family peptidase [Listeria monocytogenes]